MPGRSWYLKGDIAAEAFHRQLDAMESDDREGIIEEYLGRLLPAEWDGMDLYQRRSFLGGSEFDGSLAVGTVPRDRVCILEIWCECFGKERSNIKRSDSYEIEGILNKLGWSVIKRIGTARPDVHSMAPQKTFVPAIDRNKP
mgnify:CR=1 FL=1